MRRALRRAAGTVPSGPTLEERVYIEMLRTAQAVGRWVLEEFKAYGLTPSQYNVLRILRGARPEPLSSRVIAERMIHDDPDLTRLLDRLEAAGLVAKERSTKDRRAIEVRITRAGLERVEAATPPMRQRLRAAFGHLDERRLDQLADLLRQARRAHANPNPDPSPGDPSHPSNARPTRRRRP
jgi:DNA-binding MarR family transcriptional regulator